MLGVGGRARGAQTRIFLVRANVVNVVKPANRQPEKRPTFTTVALRVEHFRFQDSGQRLRVSGFGSKVSGFRLEVAGSGFRVAGSVFRVACVECQVEDFGTRFSIFGLQACTRKDVPVQANFAEGQHPRKRGWYRALRQTSFRMRQTSFRMRQTSCIMRKTSFRTRKTSLRTRQTLLARVEPLLELVKPL